MYRVQLDLYSELEKEENPVFICEDDKELNLAMNLFFKNGYQIIIEKKEGV